MNGYLYPFLSGEGVSQEFGADPGSPYNPPGGHTGIDFAVFTGTPVHAAADGIIDAARVFPDYDNQWLYGPMGGLTVVLNCGEHKPSFGYSHLSRALVKPGDRVRKGQVIALSGNSGTATTGAHCHVEALPPYWNTYNGTYGRVNPRLYFNEYPTHDEKGMASRMATLDDDDKKFIQACVNKAIDQIWGTAAVTQKLIQGQDVDESQLAAALLAQGKITVEKN